MEVILTELQAAGLNAAFMGAYETYEPEWVDEALPVPSTSPVEPYAWLGSTAAMEELKDEPVPQGLKEHKFSITNKDFQAAIEIHRNQLKFDKYGQALLRVSELAEVAKAFPSELIRDLRTGGLTGLCYNGQPFYSTTHTDGDSNLVTGTGTTDAQIQADAENAIKLLFSMKTDRGKAFPRKKPKLVAKCGPAMYVKLLRNLISATVSTGGENVFKGIVSEVRIDHGISGNDWWIDDLGQRLKPFIVQESEQVTPENTVPGSDSHVRRRRILYVANWQGNGGYGMYKHSVMINN